MKRLSKLAVAVVAVATTWSAQADVIDARFSGTVGSQINTTFAVGAAIAGQFVYDTYTNRYLSFTVGSQSVAPGYASSADITPDLYSAIYQAQVSPVQDSTSSGLFNSTFSLDLEGLNRWPSNNAVALLTNAVQLATNLDTAGSGFGFYTANADGTGVRSVNATLTGIQVSAIPEPSSMALLLVGLAAVGLGRARQTQN